MVESVRGLVRRAAMVRSRGGRVLRSTLRRCRLWFRRKDAGRLFRWLRFQAMELLGLQADPIPYIVLSYPRSGNHWVRYVIEWFSGRPTLGADDGEHWRDRASPGDLPIHARSIMEHVGGMPIGKKRHWIKDWDSRGAQLVFVIRNYKECVARHLQTKGTDPSSSSVMGDLDRYALSLCQFDSWPNDKHLVRYEGLIERPREEICALLDFLNLRDDEIEDDFFGSFEFHQQNALGTLKAGSATQGQATDYHARELTREVRRRWDRYLVDNYPRLTAKYLEEYRESEQRQPDTANS